MNRGRKITSGKYHKQRKSKLYEYAGQERHAVLGKTKLKQLRVRGGAVKTIILKSDIANIIVEGKAKKAQIINVEETPQNPFLARQNRLIKGAIIATSLGKARITNRPSQEGCVNAILLVSK
jgi:small subunit ribosomal protein S8e